MTALRCGLNQTPPMSGCDGANGQLVDTDSSQTLANKNFNGAYFSGVSAGMTCNTPPTPGFKTVNGIVTHC